MTKSWQVINDFSAGELAPEALQRKDTRGVQNGLSLGRNIRIRNGGGFSRRHGFEKQQALLASSRKGVGYAYDGTYRYSLIFSPTRMDAYFDDGTAAGNVTGAAWTSAEVQNLQVALIDQRILVSHQDLGIYEIERTGAATWTIGPYAFDAGTGGSISQPYYRYAAKGIAITPSALTGAGITVTASAAVFAAGHVGTRIRYHGKEISITGYTSPTVVTGTVIQTLPGTFLITMGSNAGFQTGQVVEGETSATTGYVISTTGSTQITVIILTGLTGFSSTEIIVGPDSRSTASAVAAATPGASVIWDEQAASAVHGYPGEVQVHRKRLGLARWRDAQEAWNFSQVASIGNFDTGDAADDDAIAQILTASPREMILNLVPAETLLVMTDQNVYYVPEGRENVLSPTYSDLFKAAPVGSYPTDPVIADQGVLFIDNTQTRVWVVSPTGQITSPWSVTDLSQLVPKFMRSPRQLSFCKGRGAIQPERYAFVLNDDDGSLPCLFYKSEDPIYGWTLWETEGEFVCTWALEGVLYAIVLRTINGTPTYFLEKADPDLLLDCATAFSDPDGDAALAYLEGETVHVVERSATGWASYGQFLVGASGVLPAGLPTDGGHTFYAGFSFATRGRTISPVLLENIKASGPLLRIPKAYVTTQESGAYRVNGQLRTPYDSGEDDTLLAPLRSEVGKSWYFLGRSPAPTVEISQDEDMPAPLTVLSVTMEVRG